MGCVRLRITPSLAGMIGATGADWLILETEIEEEMEITALLANLARSCPELSRSVYNPIEERVAHQVMVVLNDDLIQLSDLARTKVKDGDTVVLLPDYYGG